MSFIFVFIIVTTTIRGFLLNLVKVRWLVDSASVLYTFGVSMYVLMHPIATDVLRVVVLSHV